MTTTPSLNARFAPIALLVAGLCAANWYFAPQHSAVSLVGVGTMAGVWIVATGVTWLGITRTDSERRYIILSAVIGGLMLAGSEGLALAKTLGVVHGDFVLRAVSAAMGFALVVLGNALPKVLTPPEAMRCAPEQMQKIQRLSGWMFVIAGFVYMAAWIFLPLTEAATIAVASCGAIVAFVLFRAVWTIALTKRKASST